MGRKSKPNYTWIEDHLLLGNLSAAERRDILIEHNVRRVLTIMDKEILETKKVQSISYMHVNIKDEDYEDILSHLPECCKFISDAQELGHTVYVHCRGGISRSSTVVIAFLMKKYQIEFDEAMQIVRRHRFVVPKKGFKAQLSLWRKLNYTIDGNNLEYRRFLVDRLSRKRDCILTSVLDDYFRKNDLTEDLMTKEVQFVCANCTTKLFSWINVLSGGKSKSPDQSCPFIYIEPMQWMAIKENISFIVCPSCDVILGEFNLDGFNCCRDHQNVELFTNLIQIIYRKVRVNV